MDAGDVRVDLQPRRGDLSPANAPRLAARHVGELVRELAPRFEGTVVKDVDGLPPRDLVFVVDAPHEDGRPGIRRLLVSASPEGPRLHAISGRMRRGRGPRGPFFERAIAELQGARFRSIEQIRGDRIVRIAFDTDGDRRALLAELVGRHANLVLVDRTDRVLAICAEPPRSKDGPRLVVGEPWVAPPGVAGGTDAPPLAEALPEPPEVPERAREVLPLSWRVEWHLGRWVERATTDRERKRLADRLSRRLKRTRTRLDGLTRRATATERAERVREDGELLKANLQAVARGARSIEVDDWFADEPARRTIALDPKLDPRANVERLFARYKKLVRDGQGLAAERARLDELVRTLEERIATVRDEELDRDAIAELARAAEDDGLLERAQVADPRKRKAKAPRRPYRSFESGGGTEIRVGRSAADNDELTFRCSRGNDLWLHTADAPGSHVVVPLARGAEPDPEDVLDAAHLAVHFSPLQGAQRADVHVCRRKEVRKPKGAPPGLVHLAGGRTLQIRLQPDRLRRLLGP